MRVAQFDTSIVEGPNWNKNKSVPTLSTGPKFSSDTPTIGSSDLDKFKEPGPFRMPEKPKEKKPSKSQKGSGSVAFASLRIAQRFKINSEAAQAKIRKAADILGEEIVITSAKRTPEEQAKLQKTSPSKAAKSSPHVYSKTAFDLRIRGKKMNDLARLFCALSLAGWRRIGIYDISFHVDDEAGSKVFLDKKASGAKTLKYIRELGLVRKHETGTMNQKDLDKLSEFK